jgi:acyl carrier protein
MIADKFEVKETEIQNDSNILAVFSPDSLDAIELIQNLEATFRIQIPTDLILDLYTPRIIAEYISRKVL